MIGLPHQPESTSASEPEPPPSAARSSVAIGEGRIGNAFACERCRKHKVRCVPSDAAGLCQRCQKARVECIEHIARRRPAKPRIVGQTPNRVAELEKTLDRLSTIVSTPSAPSSVPQPILPPVSSLPSQRIEPTHRTPTPAPTASVPPVQSTVKPTILPNPGSTPEPALSFWESINETVSGLGRLDPVIRSISVAHMQLLLENYRTMVDFFPFVALPRESFCRDLIQQRPMVMFAILTVASNDSALLQLTLSREFRKVAMIKIMKGEKTLDLLQGLLVFIAWHHHYMDSQAISIHMLLHLCVGIADDLGLDSIPTFASSPFHKQDSRDREAKRAYLGCYYLACNLALSEPGRTRSMSYSNTIRVYASELGSAREYPPDSMLPTLIDTCQFMEDVEETFCSLSEQALIVKCQLKRLTDRWESMRHSTKQLSTDYKTLQWLQMAAQVHVQKAVTSLEFSDGEKMSWAPGFQLSLRIAYLRSIEQFLDNSTHMVAIQYEFLSIVDWVNLVSTLTCLGKLVLHTSAMPGWDPVDLQLGKTFDYFRDQLCSKMPPCPRETLDSSENVFGRFRRITATMKTALRNTPGRSSPNGSTFEITTSSRQTVSLLQELPKPNGITNGADSLPAPWKLHPQFDMSSSQFPWKFLMGTV
ncbi:hypothetical protein K504DRAFT_473527 [Pleomassaria siparia CBS 279.74]|uniref:Zn(2)-C6 fungal-type domain-containing protein n=1 Tax=Pleomassaria siparia CBS 279.74 TaxID=1314801 RepID=A0A6G1JUZ3_9PLEO|nr:hypothetical protein K504DRAFT_473527 [Pleomassaria siparia CBS 279.74]